MNATRCAGGETKRTASSVARSRMRGGWREVAFTADWDRVVMIHLEVDPGALAAAVPFELDLWDGRAFVTLVAFTMRGMKPVLGGALGAWLFRPIATHRFLNVRTYVKSGEEVGIHFLAEWLSNGIAVRLGPPTFGLPYRHGELEYAHGEDWGASPSCGTVTMHRASPVSARARDVGSRHWNAELRADKSELSPEDCHVLTGRVMDRGTGLELSYRARVEGATVAVPCERGSLEEWLMERYTAYTVRRGVPGQFRVWHEPWPKVDLSVDGLDKELLEATWPWMRESRGVGAQYSPGVKGVWMGWPRWERARRRS